MKAVALVLSIYLLVALPDGGQAVLRRAPRTLQQLSLASAPDRLGLGAAKVGAGSSGLDRGLGDLDCGGNTTSCASCTSTLTCVKLGAVLRPTSTAACPRATPYCQDGHCVASLSDPNCSQAPRPSSDFTCNGDGYFPDPGNCHRYFMCVDSRAYLYDCSSYSSGVALVYSHARAMCVLSTEAKCVTTSCTAAKINQYQLYANDHTVYMVCTDTVASHALVAACPANHTVDTATGDCVLTCTAEGRLADTSNSSHYYECVQLSATTLSAPLPAACPGGSAFSQAGQRCVPATATGTGTIPAVGEEDYYEPNNAISESLYDIPKDLLIGSATASYQVEGGWNASGKGLNIWDVYFHSRPTLDNGDVACDSYRNWQKDIDLLEQLKMDSYRFSLSWTRLLPTGGSDNVNQDGIDYYNNIINALLAKNITPTVTLHHWDLPQVYQDDGGWLNSAIQDRFVDYARFVFDQFGDRVNRWLMFNEPHIFCTFGYENGIWAPGVAETGTGNYGCVHNMVLAHAKAYRMYESEFKERQGGKGQVGSSMDIAFAMPLTKSDADKAAAERYMTFSFAWIVDPLVFGEYPAIMRQIVDANSAAVGTSPSRLPSFTEEEKAIIKGTMDFIGVNHYTTTLVTDGSGTPDSEASYANDTNVASSRGPNWRHAQGGAGGAVTPWGLRGVLNWIHKRYNGKPIMVTENGYGTTLDDTINDTYRSAYYSGYMRGAMRARNEDGVNLIGYTAWSLMDNLEWTTGYASKYGVVSVDFNDSNRPRTIKTSGKFVRDSTINRHVSYVPVQ